MISLTEWQRERHFRRTLRALARQRVALGERATASGGREVVAAGQGVREVLMIPEDVEDAVDRD